MHHTHSYINLYSEAISSYIYCQDTLHKNAAIKRPVAGLRHSGLPTLFLAYQRGVQATDSREGKYLGYYYNNV